MTDSQRWGDLVVAGDDRRREIRRRHRNGVDAVEVREHGRRLAVTFLEQVPDGLGRANVRIDAPARGTKVAVRDVRPAGEDDPELQGRLIIELDRRGSEGTYHLRLVERGADGRPGRVPFRGIDPRFAGASFSFAPDAPNPVLGGAPAPAAPTGPDDISYLARDFDALCGMMLDRLAVTIPEWTERHIPDIGITLVELLGYEGDDLSYYQDAVATEAYLQTARRRISVRRHSRLAGYRLHEGCNARAWVCLEVDADMSLPLAAVGFATLDDVAVSGSPVVEFTAVSAAPPGSVQLFAPLWPQPGWPGAGAGGAAPADHGEHHPPVRLRRAHNRIALWSWGEHDSWLVAGATSAVLTDEWAGPHAAGRPRGRRLSLRPGDVLLFEEIHDPTGAGPADPAHRHAVRLTAVDRQVDELYEQPIVGVAWADEDALPFALRVAAPGTAGEPIACTVARGNTLLADHGLAVAEQVTTARPALSRPGLSYACPFPDPAQVGRSQSRRLRRLFDEWREQIHHWRQAAERGSPLSGHQLAELRSLLGDDGLEELHLGSGGEQTRRAERDARGLTRLLMHAGRLLAARLARVEVLAALAGASGPLESLYIEELAEDWGRELTSSLHPGRPAAWGPASAISQDPRAALPRLELVDVPVPGAEEPAAAPWVPVLDLLESSPDSRDVVVEVDDDGIGHLRFAAGAPLPPSGAFTAHYRVGNGADGNVVAESINAVFWLGGDGAGMAAEGQAGGGRRGRRQRPRDDTADPAGQGASSLSPIVSVRNPLAAAGGTPPEQTAAAKLAVPGAYLIGQPRALSAADYATLAEMVPGVARAAAQLCWTGARLAADVAVQPSAGEDPGPRLLGEVHSALWPARRIGHDLWVRPPTYRPLLISADVIIRAEAHRTEVAADLRRRLSSGWLANGSPALFNPQRLGFGTPVYASGITAAIQAAPGVVSVTLTRLGFADDPASWPAAGGQPAPVPDRLDIGPMEVARLDNDPAAPQNGWATIALAGGR